MQVTVPDAGFVNLTYVKVSPSISEPSPKLKFKTVSSFVAKDCGVTSVGASLTAFTVILTVAVFESSAPSLTL